MAKHTCAFAEGNGNDCISANPITWNEKSNSSSIMKHSGIKDRTVGKHAGE